ncbi:hypothetical protein F5B19DRAFT_280727 [Rostrohypoxylon terebratum]|nr:hypothetical protein F5B19DRAFT_280727 [Rostrohypoxylon terebratum]
MYKPAWCLIRITKFDPYFLMCNKHMAPYHCRMWVVFAILIYIGGLIVSSSTYTLPRIASIRLAHRSIQIPDILFLLSTSRRLKITFLHKTFRAARLGHIEPGSSRMMRCDTSISLFSCQGPIFHGSRFQLMPADLCTANWAMCPATPHPYT